MPGQGGDQAASAGFERPLDIVTLRQLFTPLVRYRAVALATAAALFALAAVVAAAMKPDYDATMKVMVKRERMDPIVTSSASDASPERVEITEDEMNSEVELLRSRDLLQHVALVSGLVRDAQGTVVRDVAPDGVSPELKIALSEAVLQLQRKLTVTPIRKSTLIELRYRSTDPERATEVLRQLAHLYIEKHLELRRPAGAYAFFQDQAQTSNARLTDAEARLADFGRTEHIVAPGTERDATLQALADFEASLQRARAQVMEADQRIATLKRQMTGTPVRQTTQLHTATDTERIRDLKSRLFDLERKQVDMRRLFSPTYPPLEQLTDQIAHVQQALVEATGTPVVAETTDQNPTFQWLRDELARTTTERDGLIAREKALAQSIASFGVKAQRLEDARTHEQTLERELKAAQQSYELYERKKEEARISDALDQTRVANVAIAEQPTVPALPSSSRRIVVLLLGALMALVFGAAVACVCHLRNPFFRGAQEVAEFLEIPVLATLSLHNHPA